MQSVDLKKLYGSRYIVSFDEATETEPSLKKDPTYFLLRCKYGTVSPYGGDLIEVWIPSAHPRIRNQIRQALGDRIVKTFDADDGLGVVVPAESFTSIASIIKPRKRPKLSESTRLKKREQLKRNREGIIKPCR